MNQQPIGVFDSGLGGLTVVKELMKILPHENIVYFGDTGRVPYGTRGKETIIEYAKQDIQFLQQHQVKMIIAACGTVSAVLPKEYSSHLQQPYTGVVIPSAQAACAKTKTGHIGVLGTSATIRSGAYGKAIRTILPKAVVTGIACP
ncbi:MAG: glutamate racemase, partial [Massilioclostridium sp.]